MFFYMLGRMIQIYNDELTEDEQNKSLLELSLDNYFEGYVYNQRNQKQKINEIFRLYEKK